MTEPRHSLGVYVDAVRIGTAMMLSGNHSFKFGQSPILAKDSGDSTHISTVLSC
jgi:hypothetical protein